MNQLTLKFHVAPSIENHEMNFTMTRTQSSVIEKIILLPSSSIAAQNHSKSRASRSKEI